MVYTDGYRVLDECDSVLIRNEAEIVAEPLCAERDRQGYSVLFCLTVVSELWVELDWFP